MKIKIGRILRAGKSRKVKSKGKNREKCGGGVRGKKHRSREKQRE